MNRYSYLIHMSWWKKIGLLIVLLSIIAIGIFWRKDTNTSGYVFDTVKRTSITEVVDDSGKIISDGKIPVTSPTNGIITHLFVKNEQHVTEGQDLFAVKSSATIQEQQTAYAAYQSAVAAQNAAETLLHTYRSQMYASWKLFTDLATNSTYEKSKGIPNEDARTAAEFQTSQEDWLAAEKQFKDQEQAVAAAIAQVNATWTAYVATQNSVVTAPVSGIVTNLAVSEGKSVITTSPTTPATVALTLVNSSKIEGILEIGQTDIAKVKPGQLVKIYPDAYKDRTYEAKVTRVDTLGQEVLGVITYNVYVDFTTTDALLRSGMTIDGDIITKEEKNVLTVPNSAIILYNGHKSVRVLKNNQLTYIPITIGMVGQTRTQVINGLTEGQQIVVSLTNEKATRPSFMGL